MKNLITNNKNRRKLLDINFKSRTKLDGFDKIYFKNKELINLSSNDYLGLSKSKDLRNTSINWIRQYGTSLSSSRMISGNLEIISEIEKSISKHSNNQNTTIMGSGFQTNLTLIPAITGNSVGQRNKFFIFSDKLNHSSINHGCAMTNQKVFRYRHLDYDHLEYLLQKVPKNSNKIIISETVFSMDGDLADIKKLRFLSYKFNCLLYFDEAHAMGVYGGKGFGLASDSKKADNEIIVGTFGKAFGSYGSFFSCSNLHIQNFIDSCSGLIYSTVLPPSILGAIYAAVNEVPKLSNLRTKLIKNSIFLLDELKKINYDTGESSSHIIPLIFGNIRICEKLKNFLLKNGFFVKAVKSPTVPIGSERVRISLTATIQKKVIKELIKTLKKFNKK